MASLSSVCATNYAFPHLTSPAPVAIFVGGTSGIGEAMARAFAAHTKGNANIILIGRNLDAAESILTSLPRPDTSAGSVSREFIQCDVTLMKNVQATTESIVAKYPKINYLVLSPGFRNLSGRDETDEGIDKKMAVNYYARWSFIRDLAPALRLAKDAFEEGAVISILAPGKGGSINVDDLGLKETYSVMNAGLATPTYNDLMMGSFPSQYPLIPFIHAYPGVVRTSNLSKSSSVLIRSSGFLMNSVLRPLTTSPDDCAEYMWSGIYSSNPGASRVGSNGEDLGDTSYYGDEEQRVKLWEHTKETVDSALKTPDSVEAVSY